MKCLHLTVVISHVKSFSAQTDKELATGEFFLRESEKRRQKMNEIKVWWFLWVFMSSDAVTGGN